MEILKIPFRPSAPSDGSGFPPDKLGSLQYLTTQTIFSSDVRLLLLNNNTNYGPAQIRHLQWLPSAYPNSV